MHVKRYEGFSEPSVVTLTHRKGGVSPIYIHLAEGDMVAKVVNRTGLELPFRKGSRLKWDRLSTWSCDNGFLVDGADPCPRGERGFLGSSMDSLFH